MQQVFECKKCGQCCNGKGGIVLSILDIERLSKHFNTSCSIIIDTFSIPRGNKYLLKQGSDGFCIFFREDKGCTVHADKPDVCKAWPFFRGNLEDEASFAMARDYCPGIRPDCDLHTFRNEGLKWLLKNDLIRKNTPQTPNALVNAHLLK